MQIEVFRSYRNAFRHQSPLIKALKKADDFAQRAIQPLPFLWRSQVTRSRGIPPTILRHTKYVIDVLKSALLVRNTSNTDRFFRARSLSFSTPRIYRNLEDVTNTVYAISRAFCTYVQEFHEAVCPSE